MIRRGRPSKLPYWRAFARPVSLALVATALLAGHPAAARQLPGPPAAAHPAAVTGGPTYVEGVDASHYNGEPDWSAAKDAGVKFAFVKATDGTLVVDEQYERNRTEAASIGLWLGAYHYAHPDLTDADAVTEADFFVDNAHLTGTNLLPVLDLEDTGGLGPKKLTTWVKAWLGRVQARLGVKAIIYTGFFFWHDHMANSTWFANHGYRLWIAHWTDQAQPRVPANNWAGKGWTLWQYSSTGSVPGFTGDVDLDRYNGSTLAALKIKNNR